MAVGFPPSYQERAVFPASPDQIAAEIVPACMALGWSCYPVDVGMFTASTGFRFISYGETIRITVDGQSGVHVYSESVNPMQWFDWGMNRGNVLRLLGMLEQRFGVATPGKM